MKTNLKSHSARKRGFDEVKRKNPRHKNFKQSRDVREDRGTVQSRFGPRQQAMRSSRASEGVSFSNDGTRDPQAKLIPLPLPEKTRAPRPSAGVKKGAPAKPKLKLARILVPIDFSKWSAGAVSYAGALAAELGVEIVLLNVVEKPTFAVDARATVFGRAAVAEGRQAILEKLRLLTEGTPSKCHHLVQIGRPWVEICNVARDERCDLIIICKHGSSDVHQAYLGSVAEKVVRHAPCAVLALKPKGRGAV